LCMMCTGPPASSNSTGTFAGCPNRATGIRMVESTFGCRRRTGEMANVAKENPFTPGYGGKVPPMIAGRESEKRQILAVVQDTLRGVPGSRDAILIGPRGMGKTTLLAWLRLHVEREREAGSLSRRVRIKGPTSTVGKPGKIGLLFSKKSILSKFRIVEIGARHIRSKLELEEKSHQESIEKIARQTRKSPLIVLVDEAHELSGEQLQALFHTTQDSRIHGAAVTLVMAGTPHLRTRLGDARALFAERARQIDVGPLDRKASREAITAPLKDFGGVGMAEDALEAVVEHSQQYPYFLQLWGAALWEHAMAEGRTTLDLKDVEECDKEVQEERTALYEKRCERWNAEERKLLVEIGRRLGEGMRLNKAGLEVFVAECLAAEGKDPDSAHPYVAKAINEGVLWKRQGESVYGPGIPSFLGYLEREEELMKKG